MAAGLPAATSGMSVDRQCASGVIAISLVFLMRSVPGAPPTGTLRVSKSVPDGFVPPAGTCSLRPSLGATLRAAVAVQIVCPDDLSSHHLVRNPGKPVVLPG